MENRRSFAAERGMTLIAVMMMMTIFAVLMLAVAPSVHQQVQREKELEAVRRGEEVADAIRQYVIHHNGTKLPDSMDDLLEGLPQGTKKRMILRASAATDPLSEDGKWRLIKPDPQVISAFAKRVQAFNNGLLPNNPTNVLDRYSIQLLVNLNTETEDETAGGEDDIDVTTDNQPFIGVASQSRNKSIIAYYGIERHSNWIFTPLFRGNGTIQTGGVNTGPAPGSGPIPPRPPIRDLR
jgi:type II secretory pathway pseudopilin PulG